MSIATQIERIQNLVGELRTNIQAKGVSLANDADLETCVDAVAEINTSGSGGGSSSTTIGDDYLCFENTSTRNSMTIKTRQKFWMDDGHHVNANTNFFKKIDGYTLEYSTDKITWHEVDAAPTSYSTSGMKEIYVIPAGGKVYIRSNKNRITYKVYNNNIYWNGVCFYGYSDTENGKVRISGNVCSLVDNGLNTEYTQEWQFAGLFWGAMWMSAENLTLPECRTTGCFSQMFYGCTNLTGVLPRLPSTKLTNKCYTYMFYNCTGLGSGSTLPELPATTLKPYCYDYMFYGCTGITTAPVLPATTLVEGCYNAMFYSCSNLNYIKAMFTTTPSATYTSNWVQGVATYGTFVKNSAATWTDTGSHSVPANWTIQTASA